MFSSTASLRSLSVLTRQLGVSLSAGIGILKSIKMARDNSHGKVQAALAEVLADLKEGKSLSDAFEEQNQVFPRLFIDLVVVGERTGNLPEVLKSLSRHYENQERLKRDFISSITLPLFQFGMAILIIAGLIYLLGIIGSTTGTQIDVLGFGLVGTEGAIRWLTYWFMAILGVYIFYKLMTASLNGQRIVHQLLMKVPVIGSTMRAFAIARFSWAFSLTQGGGMPIEESLETSLRSTANGVFASASPGMIDSIMEGDSLYEAMQKTDLFPVGYLEFVHVSEESGTVPESMERMSHQFEEDATRSLDALAQFFAWTIWGMVAIFIIVLIFRIASWYLGLVTSFSV